MLKLIDAQFFYPDLTGTIAIVLYLTYGSYLILGILVAVYREYLDRHHLVAKPVKLIAADINEPAFQRRVPGTVTYASPGDWLRIHVKNAGGAPASNMTEPFRHALLAFVGVLVTATSAFAQLSQLAFKAEDFRDDERVYWARKIHSESGVQKYGYDLDVRRYDASQKKWVHASGAGDKNSDWYVYGRPVYAMRSGKVIACWRNSPENPKMGTGAGNWNDELTKYRNSGSRIYGGGNGFWIEHADGSRAEYAHFKPGTVPAALCPHNDALMPSVIKSPDVVDAWQYIYVPASQQVTIQAGQFLGNAGNVGTSSNPHLHVHMETGGVASRAKSGGSPVPINFKSGLYIDYSDNSGPYVEWTSFAGKPIPPGPVLVWPSRSTGAEYARHGFDASHFGAFFQHLTDSGFWAEWIDTYTAAGQTYINHVWRTAQGPWRAYYLVDSGKYQQVFDQAKADGYAPVFVESCVSGRQARYSVIFVKNKTGAAIARHGLSYDEHMTVMNDAKKQGLVPVNVSVIALGGKLYYTVLYRTGNIGTWSVKSQIPEPGYQQEYNDNTAAGRQPVYLNAYMHDGKPYLSAIFGQITTSARKDRHLMSASDYQNEYESALKGGMLTRAVTSFDDASALHRFAAVWWK
ncbi:MAG: hypothetical protein ACRD1Q_12685 [Vicinamibacterales bacterium]